MSAQDAPVPDAVAAGVPAREEHALHRGRRRRRSLLAALVVSLVVVFLALASALVVRSVQKHLGMGVVSSPAAHVVETVEHEAGPFSVQVEYASFGSPKGQLASTTITWDDAWFFDDPTTYNHELATTCAVLSDMANAESDYYHAGSDAAACMEVALGQLGFEEVTTTSYQYRSQIIDEVLDAVTGRADVVAYTIARKVVSDGEGHEKALYLVAIRGSYGAEWISDANLGDLSADVDAGTDSDATGSERTDHRGFELAVDGLLEDLRELSQAHADDPHEATLLFCGHSRGAAIANLAAAHAIDAAGTDEAVAGTDAGDIRAYTFATPAVTRASDARDERYDGIFNIINPSDMVPRLPLSAWGYGRHGQDLYLPREGSDGFEALDEAVRQRYEANVGTATSYDPTDADRLDQLEADLAAAVPTTADILTPSGIMAILRAFFGDINVVHVLYSHYPDVYIAWLQTIDADQLTVGA